MSILPALLGAFGMFQAGNQQRSANDLNNRAIALKEDAYYNYQVPMLEMGLDISQMILKEVQKAQGDGAYSFEGMQKELERSLQKVRAQTMKDIGAGTNLAGYRPGDTVAEDAFARGSREINEDFGMKSLELKQQAPMMLAQALGAALNPGMATANSAGNYSGGLASILQGQANNKANSAGDPSQILSTILPHLGFLKSPSSNVDDSGGIITGEYA